MGVHYPSDVLAGWSIGIVWAMTCWSAMRALQRRRVVDLPAHPVPEPSSQGSQTSA
jgi:undecaprenyl-diphosphatase